jgi:hypothetical protein
MRTRVENILTHGGKVRRHLKNKKNGDINGWIRRVCRYLNYRISGIIIQLENNALL